MTNQGVNLNPKLFDEDPKQNSETKLSAALRVSVLYGARCRF